MGQIVTFYSYKGGVGRSMALANTAALLARWGYSTLIVDWDLEAPGLENFYREYSSLQSVPDQKGVVDLISAAYPLTEPEGGDGQAGEAPRQKEEAEAPAAVVLPPWRDYVVSIKIRFRDQTEGTLHLLTAGQRSSPDYFRKVRRFDVQDFYREQRGGYYIERLRREWKKEYDVVLIDSRTGVTDIGGICTIQLPDILVLIFTATEHGLVGAADVARKATLARQSLPFDRRKLLTLPILSRFDDTVEFEISQRWLDRVEEVVKDLYADWLAADVGRRDFVELTKIPYKAFFSFGEKLPVVEEGTVNRAGMAFAYQTLAALLANRLEGAEQLSENRDGFVQRASKGERVPTPTGQEVDLELVARMVEGHGLWLQSDGASGKAASFAGLYLRASDLSSARLAGADFTKADLNAANLADSDLARANLSDASLQGANLLDVSAPSAVFKGANLLDANLEGADLTDARLNGAKLQGARLVKTDLRRADLEAATFARADLKDARLNGAVLRDATLTDVSNLTPEQLGGTNLLGAKLPDEALKFEKLADVTFLRRASHALLAALFLLCAYAGLTVARTTDVQLVSNSAALPLPLLSFVEFTARGFYILTPVLLTFGYIILLGAMSALWRRLSELPAVFPDGRTLDERTGPLFGAMLRAHVRVLSERRATGGRLLYGLFVFAAWGAAPLTLLAFWARSLSRHDWGITTLHVMLLLGVLYLGSGAYRLALALLRATHYPVAQEFDTRGGKATVGVASVLLFAISAGAIHGVPARAADSGAVYQQVVPRVSGLFGYAPFANLVNQEVSAKPDATEFQVSSVEYLALIKGANMAGRDLRYMSARGAFMPIADLKGADLTGADLKEADMRQADLRGAVLHGASLRGANLTDSNFEGADLAGADLRGAVLTGGNLEKAMMLRANLRGADLARASLRGVDLTDSNFEGAHLVGADLRGANLNKAVALTAEQLVTAATDGTTVFPDNFGAEAKEINSLIEKFVDDAPEERRAAREQLVKMYPSNKALVISALFAALADERQSYRVDIGVMTVLAAVGEWEGTPEQFDKLKALTLNYRDEPAFRAAAERAIGNYRPRPVGASPGNLPSR